MNNKTNKRIQKKPFHFQALFKTKLNPFTQTILATIIASSLTACGGGGSTQPADDLPSLITPPVQVNVQPTIYSGSLQQQTVVNAPSAWNDGYEGQGITIGVVDSGVNAFHLDFRDDSGFLRINLNEAVGVTSTDGISIGYNNLYADIDEDFHGTHVSSIALGREYGVAPSATLLPVNVFFDDGSAYNIAIYEGIDYVARRAPIINASITGLVNLSTEGTNNELDSYVDTLLNFDSALIVAAGNGGIDELGDPIGAEHFINNNTAENLAIQTGIEDQVLSVIALDSNNDRAVFSNYPGSCTDVTIGADTACNTTVMTEIQNSFISAPGTFILAADGGTDNDSVAYSGTSMATPVVSGGLALLLSAWDNLSIQQAVSILKDTADDTFVNYSASEYGVGIMDIEAALVPIGTLKSTASINTSSAASFNIAASTAKIPAQLSNLANLPALKSVAYFDEYNRDFTVDITPAIQLEKQAINWNNYWTTSRPVRTSQAKISDYMVSIGFGQLHNNQIQSFSLTNNTHSLQYFKNSSNHLIENNRMPLASNFYSNNQHDFGSTIIMQQSITPKLKLITALQEQQKTLMNFDSDSMKTTSQVQSLGLNYQLSNRLSLSATTQLRHEQDSLMNLHGSGTFSFGENNLSQLSTLAMEYSNKGIHIYGQFQQGHLLRSEQANGSYLNIQNADIGQLKFGVMQELSPNSSWGMQAYNYDTLIHSDMSLTLPIGISASGEVENQTVRYTLQNNLQPDTVELFYKASPAHSTQYQFNMISSPDDTGFGLKLYQAF